LAFLMIPDRGIGASRPVLRDLSYGAPEEAGRSASHRPAAIGVEHQRAGVEGVGVGGVHREIVPNTLSLVAHPQVVPDNYSTRRCVRRKSIARRYAGAGYQFRSHLRTGGSQCQKGS
jgi:hypothetical protein